MSVQFEIRGMDDFIAALRNLPEDLAADGNAIVIDEANGAEEEIIGKYPERTGNLKTHVRTDLTYTRHGVVAVVKNTAKHAYIFENGTQARHTDIGANRGTMPPGHVFIPVMQRRRRAMWARLADLLRAHGLLVTGEAA